MKCLFCNDEIKGEVFTTSSGFQIALDIGHSVDPIAKEGRCCEKCNYSIVMPARMRNSDINKMRTKKDYWDNHEDNRNKDVDLTSTNKYYITTDLGTVYYREIPKDVHRTTEEVGEYTGTPVGACWVRYDGKLCKLYNTQNNLQVIQIGYE